MPSGHTLRLQSTTSMRFTHRRAISEASSAAASSISIAFRSAASIIAKEHRDRLMRDYAQAHPHYGWERNAGYGTPEHLRALREHGPCALHRRSFAPVAQLVLI